MLYLRYIFVMNFMFHDFYRLLNHTFEPKDPVLCFYVGTIGLQRHTSLSQARIGHWMNSGAYSKKVACTVKSFLYLLVGATSKVCDKGKDEIYSKREMYQTWEIRYWGTVGKDRKGDTMRYTTKEAYTSMKT